MLFRIVFSQSFISLNLSLCQTESTDGKALKVSEAHKLPHHNKAVVYGEIINLVMKLFVQVKIQCEVGTFTS